MAASRAETRTGGRPATTGTIGGNLALSVGMSDKPAPEGWRWTRLTDVARLETGHTPSRKRPEYWEGEIPWIGIKDATGNHGRKIHNTIQHTNQLGIAKSSARILPENTVCLSRTASVGYVVVMGRPMATSQDFVNWVCSENLDSQFLKYVLLGERSAFLRFASGTTHQTIYFPEVKAFHVCLPPILEQRAIAHILGTLDDKIELNRRMNETLEAMARALFKDWFVDFGPTCAKAEGRDPYLAPEIWDLFPDKLDEDGKPEGWEDGKVEDYLELAYGKSLPARSRRPGGVAVYGSGGITGFHDEAFIKGPAIIVGRKGTVGSLYWEDRPIFPIDTVFYVVPKRAALSFCYQLPCLSGLHPHLLGLEWAQTGYRGARHGCSRPRRSPIPAFATSTWFLGCPPILSWLGRTMPERSLWRI